MFYSAIGSHLQFHKKFLIHYLAIIILVSLVVLFLFSLLPTKVNASANTSPNPFDQPLTLTLWGGIDKSSVKIKTFPEVAVKIGFNQGRNPLKTQLTISPNKSFEPDTRYIIELKVKNWYGFESIKRIITQTSSLPRIFSSQPARGSVDVKNNSKITFSLSKKVLGGDFQISARPKFDYQLTFEGANLVVVPKTKLSQGQIYDISLIYQTHSKPKVLYSTNFAIIDALELTQSKPANQESLVAKQTSFQFSFNKALKRTDLQKIVQFSPAIVGSFTWKSPEQFEFVPATALTTATTYTITLPESLEAVDSAVLPGAKTISFTVAGPTRVVSWFPAGKQTGLNSSIGVEFDQDVDQASAQSKFSLEPNVPGTFSWQGKTLIFKPRALKLLTSYKVSLAAGVKSIGGDESREAFNNSFTTTGERIKTIGYSVKGRAITATYFGIGEKKILLVGTLHGIEANTGDMLSQWISYLRSNQNQIPSDRTFIIIPYTNPDARASQTRFNANGVDLNRNWDLPDWQALSYWQNRSYPGGGGSAPFSEPETQALRNLILSEAPTLSISYHSSANLVLGDGNAQAFGDWYSNQTGYTRSYSSGEESDVSALGYVITGTYEEWSSKRGIKTLVVEFISQTANEYGRNLPALKGLLTY